MMMQTFRLTSSRQDDILKKRTVHLEEMMPTHASTAKRVRSDKKRRLANRKVKSRVRTAEKKVHQAQSKDEALANLVMATSALDRASSKGIIHRRTAARKKSRLAKMVNAMTAKPDRKSPEKKK
jgi:small subunit ribosomal protein S20